MSYVVRIWEQPAGVPLPGDAAQVWPMIDRLSRPVPTPNPRFLELARRLMALYPPSEDSGDIGDDDVWLDGCADGDCGDAVWNLGLIGGDRLDEVQATVAAQATALGLNMADEQAGRLYLADGRVVPAPPRRASANGAAAGPGDLATLTQRAKQGDRDARYDLGCRCKQGDGVPRDDAEAMRWFELAAGQGLPEAQYNLAVGCWLGEGTPRDPMRAYKWFCQAADAGHPEALHNLAVVYQQGELVSHDPIVAKALFMRARQCGSTQPQDVSYELGELSQVIELAHAMQGPGKLLDALSARRRALARAGGAHAAGSTAASTTGTRSRPAAAPPAPRWHGGHAGLLLGIFSMPLVLLLPMQSAPGFKRAVLVLLLLAGAWGVWRSARDIGLDGWKRTAGAALALLPVAGTLVCAAALLKSLRRTT